MRIKARGRSRGKSKGRNNQGQRQVQEQGQRQGQGLEALVETLLQKTKIPRIRLSSLEPIEITDRLLEAYQDERLCPHFHISLQSVSSGVLKSMKRSYSQKEVEQAFERITKKVPQAFVGMDIIAGFPTESDQDFQDTLELLKAHSWTNMHVFPYSPRKGTYSFFKYQPLAQKIVAQRASQLRQLSADRFQEKIKQQVGTTKKVLLFKKNNQQGLSRDYWKVKLPPSNFEGEKTVKINSYKDQHLLTHWLEPTPSYPSYSKALSCPLDPSCPPPTVMPVAAGIQQK